MDGVAAALVVGRPRHWALLAVTTRQHWRWNGGVGRGLGSHVRRWETRMLHVVVEQEVCGGAQGSMSTTARATRIEFDGMNPMQMSPRDRRCCLGDNQKHQLYARDKTQRWKSLPSVRVDQRSSSAAGSRAVDSQIADSGGTRSTGMYLWDELRLYVSAQTSKAFFDRPP